MRRPRFRPAVTTPADVAPAGSHAPEAEWAALRRLVAEAVILQDAADDLLRSLRLRPDPADIARPCGRIKGRFAELRESLPRGGDPELEAYTAALRQILDHHVLLLKTSQGLLAGAARSDALGARVADVQSTGNPGRRLEAIRAELLDRAAGSLPAQPVRRSSGTTLSRRC